MNLQHVNVKFFVDGDLTVDLHRFIEVFHRWVAERSFDELLIDVADYRHVPAGPGVVLIGHEADYAMDNTGNRPGLRYNCKTVLEGSNQDRLSRALRSAANACGLLEEEFDELRFDRKQFEWSINDRGVAPNTDETYEAFQAEFPALLQDVLGENPAEVQYDRDPRHLFGGVVSLSSPIDFAAPTAS